MNEREIVVDGITYVRKDDVEKKLKKRHCHKCQREMRYSWLHGWVCNNMDCDEFIS